MIPCMLPGCTRSDYSQAVKHKSTFFVVFSKIKNKGDICNIVVKLIKQNESQHTM